MRQVISKCALNVGLRKRSNNNISEIANNKKQLWQSKEKFCNIKIKVHHNKTGSLVVSACSRRLTMEACITSITGCGYKPIHNTAIAKIAKIPNSLELISLKVLTSGLVISPPKNTLNHPQCIGSANDQSH